MDTDGDVVAGVYFLAIADLTGAPALGDGNQPTVVQKHVFVNQNGCRGGIVVGDVYYFLEPMDGFYPDGGPKFRFSSYDLGSSTYTQGLEMPAGRYYGLSRAPSTQEVGTPVFLVLLDQGESLQRGLYIYDEVLNTVSLQVRTPTGFVGYGVGLALSTEASVNFPLTLYPIESSSFPTGSTTLENSNGTPTTLVSFTGQLVTMSTQVIFSIRIVDPDYNFVTWHADWSDDSGFSWNPATVFGPDFPESQSLPSPGWAASFQWDSTAAAPAAAVDVRFVIDTPAWDSAGVTAQVNIVLVPIEIPPTNVLEDKINAASMASPLVVEEASAGSRAEPNKELDLVLVGRGFRVADDFGNPRVQAVLIKSDKATQAFDHTRFTLTASGEQDILNLRMVVPTPGTYDVFLLDRVGARIGVFPAGLTGG